MLRPPVLRVPEQNEEDNIESMLRTFNTIEIKDCSEGRLVAQGGWSGIVLLETVLKFMSSQNPFSLSMSTRSTEESTNSMIKGAIKRRILAKVPKDGESVPRMRSMSNKIRYEKHILQQFRGSKTKIMTKYFHTTQNNFKYSQYLLMDIINGRPLTE